MKKIWQRLGSPVSSNFRQHEMLIKQVSFVTPVQPAVRTLSNNKRIKQRGRWAGGHLKCSSMSTSVLANYRRLQPRFTKFHPGQNNFHLVIQSHQLFLHPSFFVAFISILFTFILIFWIWNEFYWFLIFVS